MVDRNTVRNLYLGTRDMKPGAAADQEKTNRRQLIAKVAARAHSLTDTVKAIAAFDSAGNADAILRQLAAVAEDLNSALDELAMSMYSACDAVGVTRSVPVRVVIGGTAARLADQWFESTDLPDVPDSEPIERAKNFPCAAVRVSLDESVPTPLQVARDHIDRERRAGQ